MRQELAVARDHGDAARTERDALQAELVAANALADQLRAEREKLLDELAPFRGLQGLAVRWAWRVQRVRERFPKVSGWLKLRVGR